MVDNTEEDFDISAIREALYGDAFSAGTEKSGRNLLIVATVTLVIAVYDVAVKSTPLVPLDFANQPDSLRIFLAAANIALLLNYILRASNDLLRTREEWATARKFIEFELIQRAHRSALEVEREINAQDPRSDRYNPVVEEWWEDYEATRDEALKRIKKIDSGLADRRFPIFIRWIRIFFFGGLPLLMGFTSLAHTWKDAVDFFRAVVAV